MSVSIHFTAPVHILAAAGKPPRFKTTAYTGIALQVSGYSLPIVVDLAGLSTRKSVTANLDHDSAKRVGHVDDVQNDGKQLLLSGIVSASNEAAGEFLASASNGYPWQASIEASPDSIDEIPRGKSVDANGRKFVGPLLVARKSVLAAVAFVPNGADDNTTVSIAARLKGKSMSANSTFDSWVSQIGIDASDMTADQLAGLHANYSGRSEVIDADRLAVAPMIVASAPGDPVEGEQRRLRQIDAAVRGDWQERAEQVNELKAQAVGGDLSVDNLLQELRQIRKQQMESTMPMAHAPFSSRRDTDAGVITAALCLAGGLSKPEKHFGEPLLEAADKMARHVSVQSLLMQAAIAGGYQSRPAESISQGNLRQVIAAAFSPQIHATGYSSIDIATVLSNTANKFIIDGWQEAEDPWREIASVKPVRDFKQNTFVRLLDSLEFAELAPAGQIKHGTLGDDTMTVTAATYAKMLAITRQDIINDDLGALTDAPRRLGRAAMMKFRRLFWTAFLASDSFFDAANNNVVTGSGTALDVEGVGMTAALKAFRGQKTPTADGGKLIGGRPAVVLVPPALEVPARRLLTSTGIVSGTDGMVPNSNPFAGLANLVVADWIGTDAGLPGGDDDMWYLLRAPAFAPAMLVAALNGRVEPTVETADADFNTLGIQMRGYNDVGFGRGEKLCGLQMAGTPA